MNASDSLCASHAVSLNKQVKAKQRLLFGKNHSSKRSSLLYDEAKIAGETMKALLASPVSAISLGLRIAVWTIHTLILVFLFLSLITSHAL